MRVLLPALLALAFGVALLVMFVLWLKRHRNSIGSTRVIPPRVRELGPAEVRDYEIARDATRLLERIRQADDTLPVLSTADRHEVDQLVDRFYEGETP